MTTFSVRVPDPIALQFDRAAADQGGRSALLRRLILGVNAAAASSAPTPRLRPVRLMVRLAPEDARTLADEAAAMGLRPSAWVAALVRRRVRGAPRFSRPDEIVLIATHGEVHRIGVNVNQIARALNTAVIAGETLDLEVAYLEDLRSELRAHLKGLQDAFRGNLAYWEERR